MFKLPTPEERYQDAMEFAKINSVRVVETLNAEHEDRAELILEGMELDRLERLGDMSVNLHVGLVRQELNRTIKEN